MTALSIIQNASSRLGLTAPSAVFSSADAQIIQLRNLMNMEGQELANRASWTKITKENTFTTTAAAAQVASVPSDFSWIINETFFNRTRDRPLFGPMSPQEWQAQQAMGVISALDGSFRFRGTGTAAILIFPTPAAGDTCAFEYVSTQWCESAGAVAQTAFAVDTDVAKLSERLITLGVIWRFKAAKGFDYGEDFRTYEMAALSELGRDGGKPRLRLEGGHGGHRWNGNISEGNWTP